jgi:hypothetical protein
MHSAPGLATAAGVGALSTTAVTVSTHSRHELATDHALRRPATTLTHPPSLLPFTEPPAKLRGGHTTESTATARPPSSV